MSLEKNHAAIRARVAAACQASGRDPAEVRILAVTKKVEPEVAHALVGLGHLDLGENRVPELERKTAWFADRTPQPRWHFIGHIQRNKARRVMRLVDELHGVDSPRLVETLLRLAGEEERHPGIYLQVKLTAEEQKYGLDPADVPDLVEAVGASSLPLLGLMTMAAPRSQAARYGLPRDAFRKLRELAVSLPADRFAGGAPLLSMGMSDDLEDAIYEGAHIVRIGTAFFVEDSRAEEVTP